MKAVFLLYSIESEALNEGDGRFSLNKRLGRLCCALSCCYESQGIAICDTVCPCIEETTG